MSFYELLEESSVLDSKVFSQIRLLLLAVLEIHDRDGISYRELKAGLNVSDGVLYFNLKELGKMGYIEEEQVNFEEKKLTSYYITEQGKEEWNKIRVWLSKFLKNVGDDKK